MIYVDNRENKSVNVKTAVARNSVYVYMFHTYMVFQYRSLYRRDKMVNQGPLLPHLSYSKRIALKINIIC